MKNPEHVNSNIDRGIPVRKNPLLENYDSLKNSLMDIIWDVANMLPDAGYECIPDLHGKLPAFNYEQFGGKEEINEDDEFLRRLVLRLEQFLIHFHRLEHWVPPSGTPIFFRQQNCENNSLR